MKKISYLLMLAMVLMMTSCVMNVGGPDVEPYFSEPIPTFQQGEIRGISYTVEGVQAYDYYCFTSATEGTVVTTMYNDTASVFTAKNKFSYDSTTGDIYINGEKFITLIHAKEHVLDYAGGIYAYDKDKALIREPGKQGLYATFSNGSIEITFKPRGKAIFKSSGKEISCEYKNENGKITVRNAEDYDDKLVFLYLPDGTLINDMAFSDMDLYDKIYFYLLLDDSEDAKENVENFDSLPDGFAYSIRNLSKGKKADINTLKTLLEENPNKKFYFTFMELEQTKIPDDFFAGIENLCTIRTPLTIGDRAFKDCKNLEDIGFEFTSIGESAFEGCESLKSLELDIPYGKTLYIGKNAFKGCSNMTYVKFDQYYWDVTKDDVKTRINVDTENGKNNVKLLTEEYVDYEWSSK